MQPEVVVCSLGTAVGSLRVAVCSQVFSVATRLFLLGGAERCCSRVGWEPGGYENKKYFGAG